MSTGRRTYRRGTRMLGIALCALGVAMLASTIARGGGPFALGVLVGGCFTLIGAARFWLAGRDD